MANRIQQFRLVNDRDYDKHKNTHDIEVGYFSKDKMEDLYPDGGHTYTVGGYTTLKDKAGEKDSFLRIEAEEKSFAATVTNGYNRLLYKTVGYACVGPDIYVGILKSRIPILLLFGVALMCAVSVGAWTVLQPTTIAPNGPLPDEEQNLVSVEDEGDRKEHEGGGEVTLIFTKEANIDLSNGKISMYFKNPSTSSHDIMLELDIVSGNKQVSVAKSSLIPAGYALQFMELDTSAVKLSEGLYEGMYRLTFYDPDTEESSLVVSQISDISVRVK